MTDEHRLREVHVRQLQGDFPLHLDSQNSIGNLGLGRGVIRFSIIWAVCTFEYFMRFLTLSSAQVIAVQ